MFCKRSSGKMNVLEYRSSASRVAFGCNLAQPHFLHLNGPPRPRVCVQSNRYHLEKTHPMMFSNEERSSAGAEEGLRLRMLVGRAARMRARRTAVLGQCKDIIEKERGLRRLTCSCRPFSLSRSCPRGARRGIVSARAEQSACGQTSMMPVFCMNTVKKPDF